MTTVAVTNSNDAALLQAAWSRLPAGYRTPDRTPTLDEARAWCRALATSHYENFHVGTWLLPKRFRPHFYAIYAYCRVSDDLGDEVGDPAMALALLNAWQQELDACYRGQARHPVFVALAETIRACNIPRKPFDDLLIAFRRDQVQTRYATMADVLDYCRCSANPVGHLVLYCCGYSDAERFALSDETCSALQLANFWQDIRSDFTERGRIYFPLQDMARFGVTDAGIAADIAAGRTSESVRQLLRYEVEYARQMFQRGLPLIKMVDRELAMDLDLFSRGGLEILNAMERDGYNTAAVRPAISKPRKAMLMLHALATRFFGGARTA